jgi:hypothetical protein
MVHGKAMVTAALVVLAGTAFAEQPPAPAARRIRGAVGEVTGSGFTVKTPDGQAVKVQMGESARIATVSSADLGAIAQNEFVGTAAVPQAGGSLRALEVHIFPESMRGTGEGHQPWDLEAGSTMTNGTVAGVAGASAPQSTMTNANVAKVAKGAEGVTLVLMHPKGQQTVFVPAGTPVVRLTPADRSALVPGARVFAVGSPGTDGSVTAARVYVGVGGVAPPM